MKSRVQNSTDKEALLDLSKKVSKISMKMYNAEKFKSGIKLVAEDDTELVSIEFF